ncbi:DUF5610 domain-containing protein [Duganella sp. LX20W]|uniref:DUF5610 domain-containing protein n=1 Tax=Rugamonas brunnea TaxID=2758569 RepID=A0A7W2EQT6_9BURK|nr:DUF5610 domain-containing protein [Rugamonas brunnea]MBA5636939.1 DUF5610 domain-containing protein [Rugamonas brunnea]
MSNHVSVNATVAAPSAPVNVAASQQTGEAGPAPAAQAKLQLNASIVQASLTVSIGAQDDPLALLLKSALTGINEALRGQFGENAIQNAMSQDNTPEGTAGRIVSLSTAFYGAYQKQHAGEDPEQMLSNFMATIKGGMEQGFKEARDILTGLNVLNGDIAGNVDKTYELVQKGYADFEAAQRKAASVAASPAPADAASAAGTAGAGISAPATSTPATPAAVAVTHTASVSAQASVVATPAAGGRA